MRSCCGSFLKLHCQRWTTALAPELWLSIGRSPLFTPFGSGFPELLSRRNMAELLQSVPETFTRS